MDKIFRMFEIGAPLVIMINAVIMILPDVIEDYKAWKMKKESPEEVQKLKEREEIQEKWKSV